jgi:hypothetical protein
LHVTELAAHYEIGGTASLSTLHTVALREIYLIFCIAIAFGAGQLKKPLKGFNI